MGILSALRRVAGRGCATCGSNRLGSIGLREIDSKKPFDGQLRSCEGCDRLFWESGFLLDDGQTFESLALGLSRGGNLRMPGTAALISEPGPPRTTLYRCILGREFHSSKGVDFVRSVLWHPVLTENTASLNRIAEKISIEVDGYSDDPREVWEIPEVSRFFWMLHDDVIGLELWMTEESIGRFLHAAAAGMPPHRRDQVLAMQEAIRGAIAAEGHSVDSAADQQMLVQWLALEALQKAEAFLAGALNDDSARVQAVLKQSELYRLLHDD